MQKEKAQNSIKKHQFLTVTIHGQNFFVDISELKEIVPAKKITPIPYMTKGQKGFIFLRNKSVPIIDLSHFMKKESIPPMTGFFVIVNHNDKNIGFCVDLAKSIDTINDDQIHTLCHRTKTKLTSKSVNSNGSTTMILDTHSIIKNLNH